MARIGSVVVAMLVFVAMWIGYAADWSWLRAYDTWMLGWNYDIAAARPGWVTFWDVFCTVLGPTLLRLVGLGVIVVAYRQRNLRAALLVVFAVELSGVITQSFKWITDRARPEHAMVDAFGTSFPSGHSLAVMAAAVALLALTAGLQTPMRRRITIGMVVIAVIAIGFGRVALNVHHPSDVIAGWALGYVYAGVCLLVLRPAPLAKVRAAGGTPAAPDTGH